VVRFSIQARTQNAAIAAKTAGIQTFFIKQAPFGLDKQVGHLNAFSSVNSFSLLER